MEIHVKGNMFTLQFEARQTGMLCEGLFDFFFRNRIINLQHHTEGQNTNCI